MAYQNFLGEFIISKDETWPKTIRYNEQRPYTGSGFNPWETERKREIWMYENSVWKKITALKGEYIEIEKKMQTDITIFNQHLEELERVLKKKVGIGKIGTYIGTGLSMLSIAVPIVGWIAGILMAVETLIQMTSGNRKKKRVRQLAGIIEAATVRLNAGKKRLQDIQQTMMDLLAESADRVAAIKEEQQARVQRDLKKVEQANIVKQQQERVAWAYRDALMKNIRQTRPYKVQYASDL